MSSPASSYVDAQTALTEMVRAGLMQAAARAGTDPAVAVQRLTVAAAALVRSLGPVAGQQAARYYSAVRAEHSLRAPFRPAPASPAAPDVVARNVDWALHDLLQRGDLGSSVQKLTGSVDRMVLDTGRDTITGAVEQDPQARAWARSIGLSACSFCAMLATRGAVYKEDSFRRSDRKFSGKVSTIKVHDHCHCFPTPVFGVYEPTAHVRRLQADWARVTKGRSGRDARLAWRQHIEGRIPARPGGE